MIDVLVLISSILAGSLRVALCLFLIYRLLNTEHPTMKTFLIGLIGIAVILLGVHLLNGTDFYRMVFEALWIAGSAAYLLKANIRMCLFVGIFYEIATAFWNFLTSASFGILYQSNAFLDNRTLFGQAAEWFVNGLLVVLMIYIAKRSDMNRQEAFRLSSVIALVGFIAVVTLNEQDTLEIPDDTIYMWLVLSVVLMMSVLMLNISRQYEVEKELATLKSEQVELLERDYTTLNNAYAINAKLFHDFHNHIGILRQFLSHEKYQEAVQYLDELQTPIQEITNTVWTGDETVDYLINSKFAVAAEKQIQFEVQVEFPRHTNIRNADLCAILGNLLDNAMEATGKVVSPKQRAIFLTIRRINQMLVIKVENSYAEIAKRENGQLQTTKTEAGLHGWGLKSAQTAAEKYDGTIRTTYEGDRFRAVVTLSYHGVPME